MTTMLHKSSTRGHINTGWLDSWHTFSFGNYYDPTRMNFGVLRVLNDDTVNPGMGFNMHSHDNMEIISIPLEGEIEHEDSLGNRQIIKMGDVQVMSAGTGISHSEKNKNDDFLVRFLQIWVVPNQQNVKPRYDQLTYSLAEVKNNLFTIVSPMGEKQGVNIYQDAWFSLGKLDKDKDLTYKLRKQGNGIYIFVLEGDVTINDIFINRRDGLGLIDVNQVHIKADTATELLLMEVPMEWKEKSE